MRKTVPTDAILIPDNATRVFTGQIFDVYQWPQKMFDGSIETFEALRRPDTVQVIAIKDNKIVMIHDEQPHKGKHVGLPGGRVDSADKDWLAAAQRELLEETGLRFRRWRLVHVAQPQPKIEWFGAVFIASELISSQPANVDSGGEKIEVAPFDFDALKKRVADDQMLGFLRPVFAHANKLEDLLALPSYIGKEVDR